MKMGIMKTLLRQEIMEGFLNRGQELNCLWFKGSPKGRPSSILPTAGNKQPLKVLWTLRSLHVFLILLTRFG